ncbi:MAG: peptide-methionine (S)-S-oxide reductase MsrA, partial [Clostridiales bacterium]
MSDKNQTEQIAIFAGGCFWCMVKPFDQYPGVLQVISGYIGGKTANPNYQEVCAGHTGHKEAVKIIFDPQKISYDQLLRIYWRQINPLDGEGQFADRGSSYSPAIFYTNQEQKQLAEKSKQAIEKQGIFDRPLAVEIVAAS